VLGKEKSQGGKPPKGGGCSRGRSSNLIEKFGADIGYAEKDRKMEVAKKTKMDAFMREVSGGRCETSSKGPRGKERKKKIQ